MSMRARRMSVLMVVCLSVALPALAPTHAHAQLQSLPGRTPQLVFSTYLGGSTPCDSCSGADTFAQSTATDAAGNIYVTGATEVSDLPVPNARQPEPAKNSTMSAFVAKYSPAGKLLWCTYLGGDGQSMGVALATVPAGGVVVAGLTTSDAFGPFPVLNGFQKQNNGQSDYFVTELGGHGNLRYSTYLGGSGPEGGSLFVDNANNGNKVAVDARGLVYLTGETPSVGHASVKFPVTPNALQPELEGSSDAFLSIIDPARLGADSLVYSSFLGGSDADKGHSVAVDALGRHVTVAGYTKSRDFPTTVNAYRSDPAPQGFVSNGFVTQFEATQPGGPFIPSARYKMRYSTYLGADTSDARDDIYGVTLDRGGLILATGRTESAEFPMTTTRAPAIFNSAPYLKANKSGDEPYLVKINPALNGKASLVYSTFLGGGSPDGKWTTFFTGVGAGSRGTVYVAGETRAPGVEYVPSGHPAEAPVDFPYTRRAMFTALQGGYDAAFMQISPGGATLGYSTYFGGTADDRTYGLAVSPAGNLVLSGVTFSDDLPLKDPAQTWPGNTGSQNAFVAIFSATGSIA